MIAGEVVADQWEVVFRPKGFLRSKGDVLKAGRPQSVGGDPPLNENADVALFVVVMLSSSIVRGQS